MQHMPIRMCIICRQRFTKAELTRYTVNTQDKLEGDMRQVAPGRGWYVCKHTTCREKVSLYKVGKTRRKGSIK